MSGPCLCGDPECPSCGAAQGTLGRSDRAEIMDQIYTAISEFNEVATDCLFSGSIEALMCILDDWKRDNQYASVEEKISMLHAALARILPLAKELDAAEAREAYLEEAAADAADFARAKNPTGERS